MLNEPTITAHADTEAMTSDEIRAAIGEAEDKLKLARDIKDDMAESWFICELRALEAVLPGEMAYQTSLPIIETSHRKLSFNVKSTRRIFRPRQSPGASRQ